MMLDTLIQELESYTDADFNASNFAVQAKVFYDLYQQGHVSKENLFYQLETIINANVDKSNSAIVGDKIKLDSLLYRIKEWLER
jgi:hypothetical protein